MVKKKTNKKSAVAKVADATKKAVKNVKASDCDNCLCEEANCGCLCCK